MKTDYVVKYVCDVGDKGLAVLKTPAGKGTGVTLKAGTPVRVYETDGYYSKIGENEWVFMIYLFSKKPKTKKVYNVKRPPLKVRDMPDKEGNVVGELYNGDTVQIYKSRRGWCKVSKDEERWCEKQYLK